MFKDYSNFIYWCFGIRRHTQLAWIVHVWTSFIISGAVYGLAMSIKPSNSDRYVLF